MSSNATSPRAPDPMSLTGDGAVDNRALGARTDAATRSATRAPSPSTIESVSLRAMGATYCIDLAAPIVPESLSEFFITCLCPAQQTPSWSTAQHCEATRTIQDTARVVEAIHLNGSDHPVAAGVDADVEPGSRKRVGVVRERRAIAQGDTRLMTLQRALKRLGGDVQVRAQVQARAAQAYHAIVAGGHRRVGRLDSLDERWRKGTGGQRLGFVRTFDRHRVRMVRRRSRIGQERKPSTRSTARHDGCKGERAEPAHWMLPYSPHLPTKREILLGPLRRGSRAPQAPSKILTNSLWPWPEHLRFT